MNRCWCGSDLLVAFNDDYRKCRTCGTLVSNISVEAGQFEVGDDDSGFYGKEYWLDHQRDNLGFPDIHKRARIDLTERNLYWLKVLMKYRLPPAKVLELGCAHGSFVALMNQAGFDGEGVELSPWVVEFGRKSFGAPISVGPLERLQLPAASLDVIALFDVLEHLPDPVATMAACVALLKPDGFLLVQTPKFSPAFEYPTMGLENEPFLELMIPDEHLYLFTEQSAAKLFDRVGMSHLKFEPAIFSRYDMFFTASRQTLVANEPDAVEAALLASPPGRMALALLDVRERELDLRARLKEVSDDRAARGRQIEMLSSNLAQAEADRTGRGEQVETLSLLLENAETDRAARGQQVEALTQALIEADADRSARALQIDQLSALLAQSNADRDARATQIETLSRLLANAESDRAARGQQIGELTSLLDGVHAERTETFGQIDRLTNALRESDLHRDELSRQIDELNGMLQGAEIDRLARAEQIETLSGLLATSEEDRANRAVHIGSLSALVAKVESDRSEQAKQIETLTALLRESEADRAARGVQMDTLTAMVHAATEDLDARAHQMDKLTARLQVSDADREARALQIETLTAMVHAGNTDRDARVDQIDGLRTLVADLESRLTSSVGELQSLNALLDEALRKGAAQERRVERLHRDAEALLSRGGVRWLRRLGSWPEADRLSSKSEGDA